MTTLERRTPATPERAGCVSGVSRISGKETASPVHPGCAKRVAVQRDALGARGVPVKPSREAPSRPSAALGARGRTRSTLQAPPPRPADHPRRLTYHPAQEPPHAMLFCKFGNQED